MIFSTPLTALAAVAVLSLPTYAAQCYNIDGTINSEMRPCNLDAPFSACCQAKDICMSSGLCYSEQPGFEGFIFASGCTDKTGRDVACPHFCPDQTNNFKGGPPVQDWNVLQCNPGVFCCRHSNEFETCCDQPDEFLVLKTPGNLMVPTTTRSPLPELNTPSVVSPPTGQIATVTVTSRPQSMDREQPDANIGTGKYPIVTGTQCQPDKSAVVGGAVGGVLGTALLSALGVIAFLLIRQAKRQSRTNQFQTLSPFGEFRIVQQAASESKPSSIYLKPEIMVDQKQIHELGS